MKTINAIQTAYKGYHFRSRLEARWAVFFDALGLKWEYEPEGFELPFVGQYLPDFFLPKFMGKKGAYVEVKPDGGDFTKAKAFSQHLGVPTLLLSGPPGRAVFAIAETDSAGSHRCEDRYFWSGKYSPGGANYPHEYQPFYSDNLDKNGETLDYIYPSVEHAIVAARSARFEHGQSGATL